MKRLIFGYLGISSYPGKRWTYEHDKGKHTLETLQYTVIIALMLIASLFIFPSQVFADDPGDSTIQWIGGATGNWATAASWSTGVVPGATDKVYIGAGTTVTISGGTPNVLWLHDDGNLVISSGTLTLAQSSVIENTLTLSGSGILTGTGDVAISGLCTWSGGTMSGTGVTNANGGLTVPHVSSLYLYRTINNNSSTVPADFSFNTIYFNTGAVINNPAGATINFNNTSANTNFSLQSGSGVFTNNGTINVNTVTRNVGIGVPFVNNKSLNINTGSLSLSNTGTFNSVSTTTANSNASINFNSGTTTFISGSSLSGAGTINFSGATVNLNGTFNPTGQVNVSSGTATVNNDLAPASLSVSGGTLTGTANITVPTLNMSGGTLQCNGTVDISEPFTWSGGTMSGSGVTNANGGLTVSGSGLYLYRILNNNSSTVPADFSCNNIYFYTGAALNNPAGATINFNNTSATTSFHLQAGSGVFTNNGTINVNAVTRNVSVGVPFINNNSLNINTGSFSLSNTGTFNSVSNTATNSGTSISFSSGTTTFISGSSLSVAGTINFSGAAVTINDSFTPTGQVNVSGGTATVNNDLAPSSLSVSGGTLTGTANITTTTLNMSGGTLSPANVTLSGLFTWSGGTMSGSGVTNANGGLTVSSSGLYLYRTLNNNSTTVPADFSCNTIYFYTGAALNNPAGATINFNNTSANTNVMLQAGSGVLTNNGTINVNAVTRNVSVGVPFINNNSLNINTGSFSLSNTGTFNSVSNTATNSGTSISFSSGTTTFISGSSLSVAGTINFSGAAVTINDSFTPTGQVNVSGGTATVNNDLAPSSLSVSGGTLTGTANITTTTLNMSGGTLSPANVTLSGLFTWSGGTMSGSGVTNANGGLTVSSSGLYLYRTLNNNSTTVPADFSCNTIYFYTGAALNNPAGATINFNNTSANTNVMLQAGSGVLTNNGTININTGLKIATIGVNLVNDGNINIPSGTSLTVSSPTFTQTSNGSITGGGNLTLSSGTVYGAGNITANVTNNGGTLNVGSSPGILNITGNYTQNSSGKLNIEIGGYNPVTGYDQLNISGIANLAGTLNISLYNSFIPHICQQFQFLTFGSKSADFTTVNGLSLGSNLYFRQLVTTTDQTLLAYTTNQKVNIYPTDLSAVEGGTSVSYAMCLGTSSAPSAAVTVNLAYDHIQIGTSPVASVVFSLTDWSLCKNVTISAFDDGIVEGNHIAVITHAISSTDTNFNAKAVDNVRVHIADADCKYVSVTLQGSGRLDPDGFAVPLTVKYFAPDTDVLTGTPLYTFVENTTKSGSLAVAQTSGITPGTYDISAVTPHCLTNVKRGVVITAPSIALNLGTLLEGNADDNNIINITDFGILAASYGKSSGDTGFEARTDFDRSGTINIADFGLLAANYGKNAPVEVP